MKKIIEGKSYDTTTARLVGESDNGRPVRDFDRLDEALYCKRTGEYFLYGEGGPATRYARQVERSAWTGGWAIMPLTRAEAMEWAERNLDADEYEVEFGVVDEEAGSHDLHVVVSAEAWARIARRSSEEGKSIRQVVEEAALAL